MRKILLVSTLAIALPALADTAPTYNRVDFQTEVSREVPNDQLNATLGVELSNDDPARLAADLSNAINDAQKKAKAYPSVKLSTGFQRTWPIYGKGLTTSSKLEGWRGQAQLKLESRDFKAASELIAVLQSSLQLNGITFSVADSTRHSLEDSLSTEAIAAFRARAETIKAAWNSHSYRLVTMNLSSAGNNPPFRPMMAMAMKSEAAAVPEQDYAGGESRITVNVSGTIELQP